MRSIRSILLPLLLSLAAPALAEPTLPVLTEAIAAPYPPAALEAGVEANVLLQLAVDAQGAVTEALVVEPAGQGFDEAAKAAALDFRFQPATDADGNPAAASILYRYRFTLARAPIVSAQGLVRSGGLPLQGVRVDAVGPQGQRRTGLSDADGAFRFADLEDGSWRLSLQLDGYGPEVVSLEVREGALQDLSVPLYRVINEELAADDEIVVTAARVAPELTERVISADQIRYLPGTSGDVVKVIQNLPGVGRAPLGIGQLLIRGTAPEDSGYYLGGASLPIVFHFSGLSTVMPGDLLEEVSLLPGSYGVRYGRTLGGVVDLRPKLELPETSGAYASVDLYQAAAFGEYLVGDRGAFTLAGRRSYIDAILNPILGGGEATFQAPRYWDGQARYLVDAGEAGTFDAMLLASNDGFRFVGAEDEVALGLTTSFQKLRLGWTRELGGNWLSTASLLVGPQENTFQIAPAGEAWERTTSANLREELYGPLGPVTLRAGLDLVVADEGFVYDVASFGAREEAQARWVSPAVYVEPSVQLGQIRLAPGLRVDPLSVEGGFRSLAVDPRVGTEWVVGPTTTLKAGTGRYSAHPSLRQIAAEGWDQADLTTARSWQSSAGVTQELTRATSAELTGYANRLSDLIVGREDRFYFFTGPPPSGPLDEGAYANDGTGWAVGLEASVRVETERSVGWLTANLSRSTRVQRPGDEARLFRYDQPLSVTALGSTELPRGWRLGARVRVGSGDPYTPVENRILSLDQRSYLPVFGASDSARLPTFFAADLRVDREWELKRSTLTTYLEVQNATNTQNPEVMGWSFDYAREEPVTGLPILPVFGLRGEI
ncbi:MAG: TonB-dependent receptor [Deltaproteobacteria bacterium]|nr:TonB-dependent receptor [Deltaproteobacteria bacterium]